MSGIIIGENFAYAIEKEEGYLIKYDRSCKLVCGSGGNFALSAMRLRLNAVSAVKHAIKLDVYSGGKIQIWRY